MSDSFQKGQQRAQLDEITDSIIALARLDFSTSPSIHGSGPLDAVAAGLIALGEELQESVVARQEAEEANEAKSRFLANMSHELRTPLTTILGSIELLQVTGLDTQQARLVQHVQDAGGMLLRLISDVLDFSRIQAGTLRIEESPFQIPHLLDRVVNQLQPGARRKGLELREDRGHLPDTYLLGDVDRLQQVLVNLVGNAIKYTAKGHVLVRTRVKTLANSTLVKIEVKDTGPGIDPERHEEIFDRFTMGDSSIRRRQSGAGLGLSISRSLLESMGGRMSLESTLGEGALFRLEISLSTALPVAPPQTEASSSEVYSCCVLVVDDTELVRTVTSEMLEAIGCTVTVAASGHEALAKVAFQEFDLILMDCQMPLMDGLETSRKLHALYPERKLKIIAITAHSTRRDEQMSVEAGMVAHLNKPYNLLQLQQVIEKFGLSEEETFGN